MFSIQAAQRTFNDKLRAVGLGRMGQVLLYRNQFQEALVYLQEAQRLVITDTRIKCWLAVVTAEVYARIKQSTSCFQNFDIARNFEKSLLGEDYYSTGFNEARLESYAGVCYMHLEMPEQALTTLQKALSLQETDAIRRRSTILTDKSAALVQLGNIKDACTDMEKALELTIETKSMHVLERIKLVHKQMSLWETNSTVKELADKIESVFTIISI